MFKAHWRWSSALLFAASSVASVEVVINEVLGSTEGSDNEYIELF